MLISSSSPRTAENLYRPRTSLAPRIISIIGLSTGDEGKGRTIPDELRLLRRALQRRDPVGMVFKVNGGANSGHTVAGLKHNLIPGGVTERSINYLALGRGVVADPRKLLWEVRALKALGYDPAPRLRIDERTMISDVTDRLLDLATEVHRKRTKGEGRGSTGRGITPAFQRETGQDQSFYDLFTQGERGRAKFHQMISDRAAATCATIRDVLCLKESEWTTLFLTLTQAEFNANSEAIGSGAISVADVNFHRYKGKNAFELNVPAIVEDYWSAGTVFTESICDVGLLAEQVINADRFVLAEHGQAYWLDKRHGFPPSVTASHTTTPEVWQSLNLPSQYPVVTLGCVKAYDTKVGTHVFLTQIEEGHPLRALLQQIEFGTSTGRQRMVGWSDLVEKGHALRRCGSDALVINKLDVLGYRGAWSEGQPLKLCIGYRDPEGHVYHRVPNNDELRRTFQPVYVELPGWTDDISAARSFAHLPRTAQDYIAVTYAGIFLNAAHDGQRLPVVPPIRFIGVGPDPDQVITDTPEPAYLLDRARTTGVLAKYFKEF